MESFDRKKRAESGGVRIVRAAVWITLVILSACGKSGPVERHWTEDVQLDDGSTIEVHRTVRLRVSNSWSGDAYNAEELDATLSFVGALQDLPAWSAPRMALVLYRDESTKEWVIVATTTSCEVWQQAGKPKPAYWEYRLRAKGWEEVPLSRASVGRRANLFNQYDQKMKSRHIAPDDVKRSRNDPMTSRAYREVWGDPDAYTCGEGNPGKVR